MLEIIILALCWHFERIIKDFKNIDRYTLIEQSPDRDTLIEHSLEYYKKAFDPIFCIKQSSISFCAIIEL